MSLPPAKVTAKPKVEAKAALSLLEQLERGPRFEPTDGTCITCAGVDEPNGSVDGATSLGIRCWRSYRWGCGRETTIQVEAGR